MTKMREPRFAVRRYRRMRRHETTTPAVNAVAMLTVAVCSVGVLMLPDKVARAQEFLTRSCGTPEPSVQEMRGTARRMEQFARSSEAFTRLEDPQPIVIATNVHVIHDGRQGNVGDDVIVRQIEILNEQFEPYGVQFSLAKVTRSDRPDWYRMEFNTPAEQEAKEVLGENPDRMLNIYTARIDALGYATFPWWLRDAPDIDGVVLNNAALPGSPGEFGLGYTAVHEVGHWLGLYHTFQGYSQRAPRGGCDEGDRVPDTPFEAEPYFGPQNGRRCPSPGRDTCPDLQGLDPISNFMDYSLDRCMTEFTPGQRYRMLSAIQAYRPGLLEESDLGAVFRDLGDAL